MKLIYSVFILAIFSCLYCKTKPNEKNIDTSNFEKISLIDTSLNGVYTGLEEMCETDSSGRKDCYNNPAEPQRKWYHYTYLKIKGDSAFVDQSPIDIGSKNDTGWSASDGGFYYYSGTFEKKDSIVYIKLKELFCDYCGVLHKLNTDGSYEVVKREKKLKGNLTAKGITINGYLFTKKVKNEILESEYRGNRN